MIEQGNQAPTELVLRDDPLFCLQVQVMPVSDRLTRLTGTLVICHDITQHKLAQLNIENQLRQIEDLQASLKDQAIRDALTGAYNLRYLQETLPRELARAARDTKPLSLVMIDVDDFKNLNDTYGHPAGDAVLQRLCAVLSNYTREGDIITRYGGDEFLVVLTAVDEHTAHQRAETWRTVFEASPVEYGGECLHSSISLGIAAFPAHAATADQLIRMADLALYRAKSDGRNRTTVYLDV
jgi:diguanylate cyclase (GGDEF)-like protein